ncbi:MFS transporter [Vineibacter terrae]|uniref:MFS transporter n=1 Tax=Vineibacter terrae TaxID=2586908 RepID=UPI002E320F58|nr:MFS transporter [Vineibacter terrae]HEX2889215.1 MFS transporter [Vineibacter terrae]
MWAPLGIPAFKRLWLANIVSNIGGWMQTAGAGWIMTEIAPAGDKALFVAAMAVATTCPVFLFGFPAGVLADRFDRRRYILACQIWMMLAAAALAVLAAIGKLDHWNLLALMTCVGIGNAMNGPAWHAVVPEIVGRRHLPQAIALNSAAFNLARTVGPVIGQVLQAVAGVFALFATNALTFLALIGAIASWRRPAEARAQQRSESLWAGFVTGLVFIRDTPALWRVWARAMCFFVPAIAFATLLPLIGRTLQLSDAQYGVLFSSFGVGAVGGTMMLPRFNAWLGADRANIAAMLTAAAAIALGAAVPHVVAVGVGLALCGGCWMVVIANNNVATQNLLPPWVRARGMAVHQIVFFGSLTVGQTLWGIVADRIGIPLTMGCAAVLLLPMAFLAASIPLPVSAATSAAGD